MYRQAEARVQKWLDSGKRALLIHGARQVGKTWLVREMLRRNDVPFLEINLVERKDILRQLESIEQAESLSGLLALYAPQPFPERDAVIFLDEIQVYPDIITKIKFLADEGRYRYIFSGSNLGVELKGIRSMPVGYVDQFQMFPMNLMEFAVAMGAGESALAHVKECFSTAKPVDEVIHRQMSRLFYYYLMTGGMPAVVRTLMEQRTMAAVDSEQKNILNLYKADFTKYEAEDRKLKIISVFDTIPSQLNKQNRRFVFTYLNRELKFDRYENSFLWLKDAAVAIPVYNAKEPVPPLEQSKASNLFKLFQNDVGLLTAAYPAALRQDIMRMDPEIRINFGSLFENYTACELYGNGFQMLYYKTQKLGEIDFIIELDGKVLPIEVKSGKDYQKHPALNHLLDAKEYHIQGGIVLSLNNVKTEGRIRYLPIYMAGLIRPTAVADVPLDMDIFGS